MGDDSFKFCYRLLASVDIVGSTAFKSAQVRKGSEGWAHVFRNFFVEFPEKVRQAFDQLDSKEFGPDKPKSCAEVWKLVGDEILFWSELKAHTDVIFHLLAIKRAMKDYESLKKFSSLGLGLKATVWGAGFPVTNVAVRAPVGSDGYCPLDYLGPAVDLGFRLTKFADSRRIPISLDVAKFLVAARSGTVAMNEIQIFLDQPQVLKGVADEAKYPILWVDRLDGEETEEDQLLGNTRKSRDTKILMDYVESQSKNMKIMPFQPFIDGETDKRFNNIPDEIKIQREKLILESSDHSYEKATQARGPSQKNAKRLPKVEITLSANRESVPDKEKNGRKLKRKKTK